MAFNLLDVSCIFLEGGVFSPTEFSFSLEAEWDITFEAWWKGFLYELLCFPFEYLYLLNNK